MEHRVKYDKQTPFNQQNLKSLQKNLVAFSIILRNVTKPRRIIEARGGMGYQSMKLQAAFPGVPHMAWERDAACAKKLDSVKGVVVHAEEYPESLKLAPGDLCVIDCNQFTLKHFDDYIPYFTNGAGQYVFTDTARGKIHLHAKAYGLKAGTWDCYEDKLAERLKEFGLTLMGQSQAPRSLTYFYARR